MTKYGVETSFLDPVLLRQAMWPAVKKLNPLTLIRNPVMFVVEIVSILATLLVLAEVWEGRPYAAAQVQITVWLWITVLFGNFAEAVAERRGRARADALRATQQETSAKRLLFAHGADCETVGSRDLRTGDIVLVETGDIVPADGEVIEG